MTDLHDLCGRLRGSPWLALDTEFIREKTYYTQLCLLQVASENVLACVDPLTLDNLDPLLDIIYNPATVKIIHSARQDMETLYDLRGNLPSPIYDTQIAAALLGYGDQVGYGALVRGMLDVHLDKLHTRTDWSRRPLDEEQLYYAADDVRYLGEIYHRQRAELASKGRLDWLTDDFAALSDARNYANAPLRAWRKVKLAHTLQGVQLAVAQALAAWREAYARSANKPRKWTLSDDVIIDLARHQPQAKESLAKIRGLDPQILKHHGANLLTLISHAKALPREHWPQLETPMRLTTKQEALIDVLMAVVRIRGAQNAVSTATLTTRRELEQLLTGVEDLNILHGWRGALVGKDLQALLQGEITLQVINGELTITSTEAMAAS